MAKENKTKKVKKEKKPKSKARKILDWVVTGVVGVFLVALLGIQINAIVTKKDNHNVPSYFGYSYMYVLTDSMETEIHKGDAVFTEKVDPSEIQVGDNVTFMYVTDGSMNSKENQTYYTETMINDQAIPFTHKVVEITTPQENGTTHYHFITKGINEKSDYYSKDQEQKFDETCLIGRVCLSSTFLGGAIQFMTSWQGLLVILLIPCAYLIILSIFDIFKALKDADDEEELAKPVIEKNNDTQANENLNLSDEDKARLKQELLDQLLKKKEGDNK